MKIHFMENDLTRYILCVNEGKTKDHKCNKCGILFSVQNDLKRHVVCDFHHKCKECGKK